MRLCKQILAQFYKYLGVVTLIALSTFLLREINPFLDIQIIALLFLLPVMISTAAWGLIPGVLAAFLSFLAFNYFFIKPYNTLLIHQTMDLIFLLIFLLVAVVMSQLIGKARLSAKLAKTREWESTRMYELISALAGTKKYKEVLQILAEHTYKTFDGDRVEASFLIGEDEKPLSMSSPDKSLPDGLADYECPLFAVEVEVGKLRIWKKGGGITDEKRRLLNAFASQGSNALERIFLEQRSNKVQILEESDRVKTSLLNSVSHELRSPLAAIKASVSSLRSGVVSWDVDERQELLATIEEETDHLNFLVGNLLDMTRIESGSLKTNIRLNSIAEIANGAAAKTKSLLVNHQLIFDFPVDLKPVPSDYVLLEQVFVNLISNSVKYAPPHTEIVISGRQAQEDMQILVCNQSPRIPEKDLQRIFEKFYRVTEADKTTGTGLGLSICKGIIEAHGGKIVAENHPDCFLFRIALPMASK